MEISFVGTILYNLDRKFCHNFKVFIGRHEKTVEIVFLIIFFLLQGIIAFFIRNPYVTLIIIIFLFFLALERIFVHIWLDYERKKLERKEEVIKEKIKLLRLFYIKERERLLNKISKLKKK